MKYTEEIFNILSRGGFISANSVSSTVKRYYDALEEDFTEQSYNLQFHSLKFRILHEDIPYKTPFSWSQVYKM